MNLEECYGAIESNYDDVMRRLGSETLVRKFVLKFLDDASLRYFLDSDGGKLSFKQGKNCQMIDFRCILIVFGCFWDAGFSIFASV